jgi:hypothetical protein
LKAAEAARQQAATALTSSCATAALGLTQSHTQQLTAAVADMSRLLLALLDGCVLPDDLVPAPVGDDSLSNMQRLSLETLSSLAAAQDAAQPAGGWSGEGLAGWLSLQAGGGVRQAYETLGKCGRGVAGTECLICIIVS